MVEICGVAGLHLENLKKIIEKCHAKAKRDEEANAKRCGASQGHRLQSSGVDGRRDLFAMRCFVGGCVATLLARANGLG